MKLSIAIGDVVVVAVVVVDECRCGGASDVEPDSFKGELTTSCLWFPSTTKRQEPAYLDQRALHPFAIRHRPPTLLFIRDVNQYVHHPSVLSAPTPMDFNSHVHFLVTGRIDIIHLPSAIVISTSTYNALIHFTTMVLVLASVSVTIELDRPPPKRQRQLFVPHMTH